LLGSSIEIVAPAGTKSLLSEFPTAIVPWWALMMRWHIAIPKPVPLVFVV
jgi:hypothetical protein